MPERSRFTPPCEPVEKISAAKRCKCRPRRDDFAESAQLLDGTEIVSAHAHGKHLFIEFEAARFVHIHLGLYGKWRFSSVVEGGLGPIGQVRLRLVSDSEVADLSGPTRCALVTRDEVDEVIARLGPDPLDPQEGTGRDSSTRSANAVAPSASSLWTVRRRRPGKYLQGGISVPGRHLTVSKGR